LEREGYVIYRVEREARGRFVLGLKCLCQYYNEKQEDVLRENIDLW